MPSAIDVCQVFNKYVKSRVNVNFDLNTMRFHFYSHEVSKKASVSLLDKSTLVYLRIAFKMAVVCVFT